MRVSKLFQLLGHSCRKAVLEDSWKFSGADFDTRQMSDGRRVRGGGGLKFCGCLRTWTIIADVAGIFTIGDDGEAFRFSQRRKFGEEFVFAKITAVIRVGEVRRVRKLMRAHDAHREMKEAGCG